MSAADLLKQRVAQVAETPAPARKKGKRADGRKPVNLEMPEDLWTAARGLATSQGSTIAGVVEAALAEFVKAGGRTSYAEEAKRLTVQRRADGWARRLAS